MDSTTTRSPRHSGPLPAFHNLPNVPLSRMIKNSGLVFAVLLIIFFFLRQYVLEAVLDRGLIYKKTWPLLNPRQKRGFVNHHLSFIAKIAVVIFAIYPFFAVVTGNTTFTTPFLGNRISAGRRAASLTIGDVLFAAIMVVTVMYAHELSYREGISPVAVAHHIGVLLMGQLTLYWSASARHQPDSSLEVVLALVWGFFDLSVEVPPHVTMILYRNPNIPSLTLVRYFGVAFWCSFIGTIAETATILALYGSLWHKWTVIMKVLIPILHCIFTAAQLWGEKCTWDLWQQEKRKAKRLASNI